MNRLKKHIILPIEKKREINFYFDGKKLTAFDNEIISSALMANGIDIFSYHHKDNSPQGIYCANGQCAQCTVIADAVPVKSCITPVKEGMHIKTLKGVPALPEIKKPLAFANIETIKTDVLIIGAGPAGLAAAIELGKLKINTLIVDDKHIPGGKLVLQTHKFFGSVKDCYAGSRGIDIAKKLQTEIKKIPCVKIWLNTVAVAVFSDNKVGVIKNDTYYLIEPEALLVAAGAREKTLAFEGNTLPGVYGAGAFQTLVNRDLIKPSSRIFIVGGGNVGLIAGYHAVQAGIKVAGLIKATKKVRGYKVHVDKLRRLGVPVKTCHTVLSANGKDRLQSVTTVKLDENLKPVSNSEKTYKVDTLLIAVGLNPCDELYHQAKKFSMNVYIAGDAEEIAEASAAMFGGKIAGYKIAKNLNRIAGEIPDDWERKLEILKSKPGVTNIPQPPVTDSGVFPVFHCAQEIPCDPCAWVCPHKSIKLKTDNIMSLPYFEGKCSGCYKCITICPGLAVTLVDYRKNPKNPTVALAYEINRESIEKGDSVIAVDNDGNPLTKTKVLDVKDIKAHNNTLIVSVMANADIAKKIVGIKPLTWKEDSPIGDKVADINEDDTIICRCERVTLGEIKKAVRTGVRDINELKAITRVGMGACGGKSCLPQLINIFKSEGVKPEDITPNTYRPLVMEVFLGQFCKARSKSEMDAGNF